MRLDVDNMSYEYWKNVYGVKTGLTEDVIFKSMKQRKHMLFMGISIFWRHAAYVRMCDLFDDNNFFIFDDESVRISSVSKMPFRKNPRDSLNMCSKSNPNKSLSRTVHKWLPKLQRFTEPVAKWFPRVEHCPDLSLDHRFGMFKAYTGNRVLLTNFVEKFLGTVRFGNNDFAVIAGYGDVVIRSMTIKKVYYVEGLGHNLFSVGQFYDKGLEDEVVSLLKKEKANLDLIESLKSKGFESSENVIFESKNQSENDCQVVEKGCDQVENLNVIAPDLDTFSSVRRPKYSGVIWKKKWSSNTSNVDLSSVSHSKLNKGVKRYSRKDLLSCNNSHFGETSSADVCIDAMNVSCNYRLCDLFDENNLFIFDAESVGKFQIVQIYLWIIDSGCSKHMTGNRVLLTNFVEKFLGTVHFGSNDFAVIAGYGDVFIGSMTIKKVYSVEGLGHNLFSVAQFYDKGLEVAFRKSTCFVRNEDGVDLLIDDCSSNLYTIALIEVALNSSTCLLAKASSSQSWLWHQCLSHLNFATINNLVKNNLVQGLPKMKFKKGHLCSACEQGKIHRKHHMSKTAFASSKPLYLLHMDLCGPMRIERDIRVFVGYSKESASFRIYNKQTRKIHESVNVNFDEILEMACKQFSLEPGLFNFNETGKSSNPLVSQVSDTSKKDLEDLFQKFYDEYFDSSKIMKSSTMNVKTSNVKIPSNEEEEVGVPSSNTQLVSNNMVPNVDEASTSHNVFNEFLEDAYFDARTLFHDLSNVHTFYQPYPHEKKWTKEHPFHKIIGDPKSSVRTRGQLANSCLLSSFKHANVAEALRDANWVSAMQDELDQFARLKYDGRNEIIYRASSKSISNGIFINQSKNILYILKRFGMENCDTVSTPMVEQAKIKLDLHGKPVDHTDYRSMIGPLMCVTSSIPDIMFATCLCARYQANPNEHQVSAVKTIFHYFKWTINLGLWYLEDSGFDLTAYSDADHAGCHLDRKKSEYVAVSGCCAQVLWMRTQLADYGFFYDKVPIYCDLKNAIAISCNPVQHTRTKYIDVRIEIDLPRSLPSHLGKLSLAPYTPQQNGVAESKNRALKEMVNSMLSYSGLSEGFWEEAMLTACYLLNRVPNKRNKTTPYELWYKKRPNLSFLRVWGCRAVVRLSGTKRKTLCEKGIDCIFVGYAKHSKAYRFYIIEPNDSVSINSIIESRDAIFDENRFSSIPRPNVFLPLFTATALNFSRLRHASRFSPYTPQQNGVAERKNKALKEMVNSMLSYSVEGSRDHVGSQYSYCFSIEEDPRTYNEAMQSRDAAFWKEAIDDEIGSILENNTWVLSDLPPGYKLLGCKWIFKRKMKVDGTIEKFKARLVIQGFRQKEGIDYFDTYAPVARITTIRLLLALEAIHNLVIHQMDVKTTFLNGDLEKVYMKQPEGFVMPGNEHKVCKLVKSLTDQNQVDKTKKFLSSRFSIKDMGEANVILVEKLKPNTGKPVDLLEYSRAIGCLMYAMISTRPDIAYDVGRLSRFTSNPSRQHWKAITRVFKFILYEWMGVLAWGMCHFMGFQEANMHTRSTMEFEFVALAAAGKEAEWLRNLIHKIPIWPKPIAPISIRCDSAPTMAMAYSQIYNGKSRHLCVRHSVVRELIRNDEELTEIDIKRMDADDQAIQTILLGLPEDVYEVVDSYETAKEIWERVRQMMKENIASNLKFINNLQPEWKRHVTIVRQTKNIHEADFTQIYDFLKMNSDENGGIQVAQNAGQNAGVQSGANQNGFVVVPGIANQNGTCNVVAIRAEGTRNGNQARCYNCRGLVHIARNCTARPRRKDASYLQTQLLIAQKEKAGTQLQAKEFDFMAAAGDLDEIKDVNANCILMANLQHASISGT
nr:hypothetical protein [Tanacetum cinerariifolium]